MLCESCVCVCMCVCVSACVCVCLVIGCIVYCLLMVALSILLYVSDSKSRVPIAISDDDGYINTNSSKVCNL